MTTHQQTFLLRKLVGPAIVFVILAGCQILWFFPGEQVGFDFGQFWAGARMPLSVHRTADEVVAFQSELLKQTNGANLPYVRLPVFIILFKPLGWFEYRTAFMIWVGIQFLLLCIFLFLLRQRTELPWVSVALQGLFIPAMFGIVMGHDPAFLPLICLGGFLLLERRKHALAGILFGLCLYKFQLVVLLPVFLIIKKQFRVVAYGAATAVVLLGLSHLVMPLPEYWNLIMDPKYLKDYGPAFMMGLRQLTWAAAHPNLYWLAMPVLVMISIMSIYRSSLRTAFAVAITVSVFVAPHVNFYDYVMLLIPVFLMTIGSRLFTALAAVWTALPMLWIDRTAAGLLVLLFASVLVGSSLRGFPGKQQIEQTASTEMH